MTRNEAIEKSIMKWEILAKTGEYLRYIQGVTSEDMPNGCALCLVAGQPQWESISRYRCRKYCPYAQEFRCCCNRGQPYLNWEMVAHWNNTPEANDRRKHYATEILGQLKQLE